MEFKIGDKVKYDIDYSSFTWYGIVVKVTPKHLDIKCSDGYTVRVHKKHLNFD